jgi:site-specific recombinase XerD
MSPRWLLGAERNTGSCYFHVNQKRGRRWSGLDLKADPHMLRHACGYALAHKGHDTRAIQARIGHRSITSTAIYTALAPNRFKDFWRD